MSGSAIRQPLSEGSTAAVRNYMCYLDTLEYKEVSKNYAYITLHAFLVNCPVETMRKNNILEFFDSLGVHTKTTVNSMLKVIKRFLSFLYAQGMIPEDFNVCIFSQKKRRGTELPSVYTPTDVVHKGFHVIRNPNFWICSGTASQQTLWRATSQSAKYRPQIL